MYNPNGFDSRCFGNLRALSTNHLKTLRPESSVKVLKMTQELKPLTRPGKCQQNSRIFQAVACPTGKLQLPRLGKSRNKKILFSLNSLIYFFVFIFCIPTQGSQGDIGAISSMESTQKTQQFPFNLQLKYQIKGFERDSMSLICANFKDEEQ